MAPITTLTNALLQRRLQLANACAARKGYELVQKKNRGIPCHGDQKKVQLIVDLIDSVREYVNFIGGEYGVEIIQVEDPAGLEWEPTYGLGGTISILDSETGTTIAVADFDGFDYTSTVELLLDSLNNHVQHGTPFTYAWGDNTNEYYGTWEDGIFTVYAPEGSGADKNGNAVFFAYQGGDWDGIGTEQEFSGGIDSNMDTEIDDTDTCLTNEEMMLILDKLCALCGSNNTFTNFTTLND